MSIKRLFSSSSLSAITVVSPAYLRLLIFPPAILIPACDSPSPAFCMMQSTYKLNKQSDSIQSFHTPLLILNQWVAPCSVLTVAPWPHIQVSQETGKTIWYSIPLKMFHSLLWSIHFRVCNEAEVDFFFWNSLAFCMIQQMLAIWSLDPLPLWNPVCTSGSSWWKPKFEGFWA